jgi:hypothetical protein
MDVDKKPEEYLSALTKAWKELAALNPEDVSKKSGACFNTESREIILPFLKEEYRVQVSDCTIKNQEGNDANPFMAVLLLHYLIYAKNIEEEGDLITFRELEGGEVYYSAFQWRAIFPITKAFGHSIEALTTAGDNMGAEESNHGDVSIKIEVFPKVHVTVIMWKGDDEVPTSSNMLFDASIKELLPTEDVAVIGGFVAQVLIKSMEKHV